MSFFIATFFRSDHRIDDRVELDAPDAQLDWNARCCDPLSAAGVSLLLGFCNPPRDAFPNPFGTRVSDALDPALVEAEHAIFAT
jgi:hypothetical protein